MFRDKLADIYFRDMPVEQMKAEIESARFVEFPQLQFVLREILVNKVQPGAITIPEGLVDWKKPPSYTDKTFQSLNSKYSYFPDTGEAIFNKLKPLCRKMTQLVERQADDNEMAYKLMALFCEPQDFSDTDKCLTKISRSFIKMSQPFSKVQLRTAYHDVSVTTLNVLPTVYDAKEIKKWREFIGSHGVYALPFFADCQSFTSVPKTLKEAKTAQLAKTYPRAGEDIEFAAFCIFHLIGNSGFEAGLDFIKTGWPEKTEENLPLVDIKVHDEKYEYRWVKLPQDDKRALYLGNMIPGCCQFINGYSKQCVIDGISLSDNGFYVLLKKKIKKQEPFQKDEASDLLDGEIVAQSYAWISTNGNLCLDSLEWNRDLVSEEILKTLMSQFALEVLKKNAQIKYVNVGTGGQTPRPFGPIAVLSETQRQGAAYEDAAVQYCIQSKLNPEVTKRLGEIPEFNRLDGTLQNKIRYLSAYWELKDLSAETITSMSNLLETCLFQPFPPINQRLTAEDFKVLTFADYQQRLPAEQEQNSTFCKLLNCENFESLLQWLPTIPTQERSNRHYAIKE